MRENYTPCIAADPRFVAGTDYLSFPLAFLQRQQRIHLRDRKRENGSIRELRKEKQEFPSEEINKEINETILALRDCSYRSTNKAFLR